jgi:hypothetical protein
MDVDIISLVKRPANRVPIRIIKSNGDNNMSVNLETLFTRKRDQGNTVTPVEKADTVAPEMVAVVVSSDVDADLYQKSLNATGTPVVAVHKGDTATILYFVEDADIKDTTVLKVDDTVGIAFTGLQKGLDTWSESTDFAENLVTTGFFSSYRTANEALTNTVGNIMYTEGNAEVTKASVRVAIEKFDKYVNTLLSLVPAHAFKTEKVVAEVTKGILEGAESQSDKPEPKVLKDDKQEDTKEDGAGGNEENNQGEDTESTLKGEDNQNSKVLDALTSLQQSMGDISNELKAVKGDVSGVKADFNSKIKVLTDDLKKAETALNGTVHSTDLGDDLTQQKDETQKAEGDVWGNALPFERMAKANA